jgi:hypothetical protein
MGTNIENSTGKVLIFDRTYQMAGKQRSDTFYVQNADQG